MKERVTELEYLSDDPTPGDLFEKLFETACQLKASGKFLDNGSFISTISSTTPTANNALPVVETSKLHVRRIYKELYKEITENFLWPLTYRMQNHFGVTGTSSISKSVFLTPQKLNYYAFGGTSVLCAGTIDDFDELLFLPETWYLVDSVQQLHLRTAKTMISVLPEILLSDTNEYKEVSKASPTQRYMVPWSFVELRAC
ncbi:hypothetical protein BC937DRAFT_94125 [Endogone sp. FLAS-F59071]|nr:hypothetical protein BC937DRAFT_94125 [Endogone sp. FLAS-F59071]|eukprot:RUS20891.1 hypothetical protein BC937DRAFT_94125 [Endogone sp. FLAS-F59071]